MSQIEQKIEDMFASRKRVTDVAKPVPGQMGPPIPGMMGPPGVNMIPAALAMQGFQCMVQGMVQTMVQNVQNFIQNSPINNPKMELARRLAAKINIQKNLGPEAQVGLFLHVCCMTGSRDVCKQLCAFCMFAF